jgi:hypothetical protein
MDVQASGGNSPSTGALLPQEASGIQSYSTAKSEEACVLA